MDQNNSFVFISYSGKVLIIKQAKFAERIMHIQLNLCRHGNEKESSLQNEYFY